MIRTGNARASSARWQRMVLVLAVLAVLGCRDRDDPDPVLADLPMLYADQTGETSPWVVVPVTVGLQEYKFVIDTCCSSTTFDRRLRSLLGPTVGTMQSNRNLSDTTVKIERCRVPKDFRIGRIELSGIVECLDLAAVEGRETPYPHDGIIGMDVLDGKVLHLDLANQRVRLLQPGSAGASETAEWGRGAPLTRDRHRFAVVQMRAADNIEESFLFDTGMLGANWLRGELFEQLRNRQGIRFVQGHDIEMIVVPEMQIGDIPLANMVFVRGTQSILGTACLARVRTLTLDLRNDRFYLQPQEEAPTDSVRTGGPAIFLADASFCR
jgi:hypothetical protein